MSFFSVVRAVNCNNVLSLGQTDGHGYHDSPLPKNPAGWKTAQNLVSCFSAKSLKFSPPAVRF